MRPQPMLFAEAVQSLLYSEGFDEFWLAYPRRDAKKDARKAWERLNPSQDLRLNILAALAWQSRKPDWLKNGGRFIPLPASWLRGERWNDEPPSPDPRRTLVRREPTPGERATFALIQARKEAQLEEERIEFLRKHPDGRLR